MMRPEVHDGESTHLGINGWLRAERGEDFG